MGDYIMRKAIFSFVAVAALTGTTGAKADAQEVTVKKGDTLWSISQGYKVSVEQVKNLESFIIGYHLS